MLHIIKKFKQWTALKRIVLWNNCCLTYVPCLYTSWHADANKGFLVSGYKTPRQNTDHTWSLSISISSLTADLKLSRIEMWFHELNRNLEKSWDSQLCGCTAWTSTCVSRQKLEREWRKIGSGHATEAMVWFANSPQIIQTHSLASLGF